MSRLQSLCKSNRFPLVAHIIHLLLSRGNQPTDIPRIMDLLHDQPLAVMATQKCIQNCLYYYTDETPIFTRVSRGQYRVSRRLLDALSIFEEALSRVNAALAVDC